MSTTPTSTAPDTETDTSTETATDTTPTTEDVFAELLSLPEDLLPPVTGDETHKGMKPLTYWMGHLPEDVKKHVANWRADYTRKTTDLANQRKQFEAETASLRAQIEAERNALYNGEAAKRTAELAKDTTEYDPYDPEGIKKHIEREAAKQLQALIVPVQEQLARDSAIAKAQAFVEANPEMKDPAFKSQVKDLLLAREELNLEDAFYIVKAKTDSVRRAELAKQEEELRQRQRNAFGKTATGKPGGVSPTGKVDAWAIYEAAKKAKGMP